MDKPKFNFLDGIIILLVVLVMALGAYLLIGKSGAASGPAQNCTAEFKMHLTRVDADIYNKFNSRLAEGESVWIGVEERFIITDQRTGKAVIAEDPTTNDIIITVSTNAVETASEITSAGTAIRVGQETAIRGKGVAGYGYIVELKTITE